jgi:acylpyruvate hydrolase
MYYKIGYMIEYVSKFFTLNPGDLFLTGTPSGVGPLKENDKVEALLL